MNQKSEERSVGVLFVCLGNICRSPTSEGVFRKVVENESLNFNVFVDSAGTANYHQGEPPDPRAIAAASRRGVQIEMLSARQTRHEDFKQFDYIIAMDRQNYEDLKFMAPQDLQARIHLFSDFMENRKGQDIPDPYYGGDSGFERVLDMIEDAARGLLEDIKRY